MFRVILTVSYPLGSMASSGRKKGAPAYLHWYYQTESSERGVILGTYVGTLARAYYAYT